MDETRALAAEREEPVTDEELASLPAIVQTHFRRSLPADAPVVPAARFDMRGRIKVGRWLPFSATEVLAPLRGFVWSVRVLRVLVRGGDRYLDGEGHMRMALLGVVPVVDASGEDLSRSAAGRCGGVEIPSAGTVGWHFGTDRWPEGEFFRYELTSWGPAT